MSCNILQALSLSFECPDAIGDRRMSREQLGHPGAMGLHRDGIVDVEVGGRGIGGLELDILMAGNLFQGANQP